MCNSKFSHILIGSDKMILCRKEALRGINVNKIIRKTFPELFPRIIDKIFKKVEYQLGDCYETYNSQFDLEVEFLKEFHDWSENPFVSLSIIEVEDKKYCCIRSVLV